MYHGGNIPLEFLGDVGGSVQISQSQSAVVGDGILVHETSPDSLGNAGGSVQHFASQGNETFRESLGDAGGLDQLDARGSVQISQSQSAVVENGILVHETGPESLENAGGSGQNCASQGNQTFRESLGDARSSDQLDAGGSVQISQSQYAVSGDGILVNETSPESLGNAGGSGQNCVSQDNETFRESLRDARGSDQLNARSSDENFCMVKWMLINHPSYR